MKIAHVVSTFPPYRGGTGSVCWYNAREAARLGHDVTVLTHGVAGPTEVAPPGVRVVRLPSRIRVGNAPVLANLGRELDGFGLVHLHYPFYSGAEVVWLHRNRVPYVATYHQDVILPGLTGAFVKAHHALIGQRILRDARHLIVTTLDYARSSRIGPLVESRPEWAVAIPNGVDCSRFAEASGAAIRERYRLGADPVALFVGGLDRPHFFKGVPVLLEALTRPEVRSVQALIVGEGDLRQQLTETAQRLGLGERVRFAGSVPDEDLAEHYAATDFLVLPSLTRGEAFGVVLLEAFASGKPVVVSDLPGVRVVAGDEGVVARPGDAADLARAIAVLADDAQRRKAMGERALVRAGREFDWSVIGPELIRVYESALDQRSSAGFSSRSRSSAIS